MKYQTTGELEHFRFDEAYIAGVQAANGIFYMTLDHVIILPENSCNRDIREMRTNQLELKIQDAVIESFVKEGCKIYDADGNLMRREEDVTLTPEQYKEAFAELEGCEIYSIEKQDDVYIFSIDTEDRTVLLKVRGIGDTQCWDRFMNVDSAF